MEALIMAYNSMPYVEMTLKEKMVATLKVHNDMLEMSALDQSKASMSKERINFAEE